MADLSDRDLWGLVREGEADAFGVLFERHAKSIYNFCFRRTADWAVAEDLTSVVFLQAWRHREDPLLGESALPWLVGIAVNVLRDHARSLRRYRRALERVAPPIETPDFAADVAERLDDEREMRRVLRLLNRLAPGYQEALLCFWSGLSYRQTAIALGVPVGTVRSRLARARGRLQELATVHGHYQSVGSTSARTCPETEVQQPS